MRVDTKLDYRFRERVLKSNRVFRYYRLFLSIALIAMYFISASSEDSASPFGTAFLNAALAWFFVVILSSVASRYLSRSGNHVNTFNFFADMCFLAFLGYASGGVESGIFYLMLPSAALAGLTTPYRLALFVAAVAAIAVLYAQSLIAMQQDTGPGPFISAGMLGVLLFGATMAFRYLESRLRSTEERAYEEQLFKEEARSILGLVVSPQVAETLIGKNVQLGGAEKDISVMFTDIRGFTPLSTQLSASQTLTLLNHYFSRLSEQIENNFGVVDKYIGDGAMALFGAPVDLRDHASRSIRAALRIQSAMHETDADAQFFGHRVNTGIGINTCVAVVGNIGSQSRMNYTAVGEGVNLAARLEQLTKVYNVPILVSEATRLAAFEYAYREVDIVAIRGIEGCKPIYQPLGVASSLSPELQTQLDTYQRALVAFRQRDWDLAAALFDSLIADPMLGSPASRDGLSELYRKRCLEFSENPPSDRWNGSLKVV